MADSACAHRKTSSLDYGKSKRAFGKGMLSQNGKTAAAQGDGGVAAAVAVLSALLLLAACYDSDPVTYYDDPDAA